MRVSHDPFMSQFRGKIGGLIVVKHYYGELVYSNIPDMSRIVRSIKQTECNSLFRRAVRFASKARTDAGLMALIRSVITDVENAYKAAIAFYMRYEALYLAGEPGKITEKAEKSKDGNTAAKPAHTPLRFKTRYLLGDFRGVPREFWPPKEFWAEGLR